MAAITIWCGRIWGSEYFRRSDVNREGGMFGGYEPTTVVRGLKPMAPSLRAETIILTMLPGTMTSIFQGHLDQRAGGVDLSAQDVRFAAFHLHQVGLDGLAQRFQRLREEEHRVAFVSVHRRFLT
jgi:hypothetical protein